METRAPETPLARDGRGRFAPGQSGNPAGKRPGTPNRATRVRELLADGDDALALQVLMDQVRAGNGVAARFVLDRLFPKPRDRDIDLGLSAGATQAQMFDRVLRLMASGEITIDEASRIVRLIAACREARDGAVPVARPTAGEAAADPVSPAFHLQTAGEEPVDTAVPIAPPGPLNRHERRRAAALARAAGPPVSPLRAAA